MNATVPRTVRNGSHCGQSADDQWPQHLFAARYFGGVLALWNLGMVCPRGAVWSNTDTQPRPRTSGAPEGGAGGRCWWGGSERAPGGGGGGRWVPQHPYVKVIPMTRDRFEHTQMG